MKNKIVYVPLAVDLLHSAHIAILKKAKTYGKVIVGLMFNNCPSTPLTGVVLLTKGLSTVLKLLFVSPAIVFDGWINELNSPPNSIGVIMFPAKSDKD